MKTAMQELIEHLRDNDYHVPIKVNLILEELLEKEKEQICNSYVEGLEGLYMGAEEYYEKTYNQNK
jgi:hypothetical protein